MRVVRWNMGIAFRFRPRHEEGWRYLADLDPDIALLQEAKPPGWAVDRWSIETWPIRDWGSAILAKRGLGLRGLPDLSRYEAQREVYPAMGTVILTDGGELVVASVHTPIGAASPDACVGYDPEAIRRPRESVPFHNDVTYAILREGLTDQRFLLAGDWNISRLWDRTHPGSHEADFFARAEADGWVECYRRFHPEGEGRTWFRGTDAPYQLDHAFCDAETATHLTACGIDAYPADILKLSDHAPLLMELDL